MSILATCPTCAPPILDTYTRPSEWIAAHDVGTAMSPRRWQVYCTRCLCHGPHRPCLEDAIKAWNDMPRKATQ